MRERAEESETSEPERFAAALAKIDEERAVFITVDTVFDFRSTVQLMSRIHENQTSSQKVAIHSTCQNKQ